jgi:prepilin-type N-terminal cleavage/methylation domain-containing protein
MSDRRGFSLLELVIVLALGGIIAGVAINTFVNAQSRMGPRSAQSEFLTMHAHTRSMAVARGQTARLIVDTGSSVVSIVVAGETVRTRNFQDAYGVEMESDPTGGFQMCMTPRGYAEPNCNTYAQEARIRFLRGGQATGVVLLPMGQALRP